MSNFREPQLPAAFDTLIRRCEAWLASEPVCLSGVDPLVVRERLTQILVARGFGPFGRAVGARLRRGLSAFPPEDAVLEIGGCRIDSRSGRVRLKLATAARSVLEFGFWWGKTGYAIIRGFLPDRRGSIPGAVALMLECPLVFVGGRHELFAEFKRIGPVEPITKAARLLVRSKKGTQLGIARGDPCGIVYAADPITLLATSTPLSAGERLGLWATHLRSLGDYLFAAWNSRLMMILAHDLAIHRAMRWLDLKRRIECVILTNSQLTAQPLWMRASASRSFHVHMVHYSQNSRPMVYRDDPKRVDFPAMRHVRVDEHWVWTPGYGEYWRALGHTGPIHVVGSVLFYPRTTLARSMRPEFRVLVFDVTPVPREKLEALGFVGSYYSTEQAIRFLDEIISTVEWLRKESGCTAEVLLKHKRGPHKLHDPRYLQHVEALESAGKVQIVPPSVNLYELLRSAAVTISIPYTSTAYVSSEMATPAIYFDPSGNLLPAYEDAALLTFASGKEELRNGLRRILAERGNVFN